MGVYIVGTTHAHKDKHSISLEQGRKHDIASNMPKMTVGQTNETKARHVEETHEMTFMFAHMHVTEGRMI